MSQTLSNEHLAEFDRIRPAQANGMKTISDNAARANLAELMERVCNDHRPVRIQRKGKTDVVMLSLADYQALEETMYLLRNLSNARRLLHAVEELAATQRTGLVPANTPSTTP